ncbi:MAG: metal-dependent hydrolase [Deltaproteobacteria bacterium]|nr:metal-dependent hydrolase [Deltaproteobacteria bacterium]MDR1298175.1 metal-dependent hydrolase [Deltaproteobacteria bacterium]
MPNFKVHLAVAAVASAVGVALGGASLGWDNETSSLAFLAGLSGGLLPDLDHDDSKPLRIAGAVAGLGAAALAAGYVLSPGSFLGRPWAAGRTALLTLGVYLLFNAGLVALLKKRTRHRGLFHSLAVPFLYSGLWALLVGSMGPGASMAVWALAGLGVFSHLLLDAGKSMSMNPLKVATDDLGASTILWVVTAAVNFLAFIRLRL